MAKSDSHIPALDGVRGLAIVLVFFHHFADPIFANGPVAPFVKFGASGVDLFFVLSGFLITGILLGTKSSAHYFRNFYMRRLLRIFPLYYTVVLACVIVACFVPASRDLLANQGWLWLYGTNIKMSITGSWFFQFGPLDLRHLWSLAVEEHFYLIWPTVILLLPRRGVIIACLAILCACPILRYLALSRDNDIASYVFTLCRVDAMAAGSVVALTCGLPAASKCTRRFLWVLSPIALAVIVWVTFRGGRRVFAVYYSSLAVPFASLVWYASAAPRGFLASRPLTTLGKYSYGLYIYHVIIRGLLPYEFFSARIGSRVLAGAVFVLVDVGVSAGISVASYRGFESQFLKLKRLFPRREDGSNPIRPTTSELA